MPALVDRSGAMEAAARLVQRGDLGRALVAYARLFQQDTRDWNVANTLGDLYIRAGKTREGVAHFTTLAEQLAADGFAAKARALYRKILRIQPDNQNAKQRIDELDRQGGGAVSPFLKRVLDTARATREVARVEEADQPPRPAAPPAPATPRPHAAGAPAPQAVIATSPDGAWPATPDQWADEWAAARVTGKAQPLRDLSPAESHRGAPPPLAPPPLAAPPLAARPPAAPPAPPPADAIPMTPPTVPARLETELHAVPRTTAEAASPNSRGDLMEAFRAAERFADAHPNDVLALETLVDIGVDAGLDAELQSAQMRLAAACLATGRHRQGWEAAADLVVRHPDVANYRELLGRIDAAARAIGLVMPPMPDAEGIVAPAPVVAAPIDTPRPVAQRAPEDAPPATPERPQGDAPFAGDDLLKEWADTDLAFENIRSSLLDDAAAAAEERMAEAARLLESHRTDEAIHALEEAMCAPHLRTTAGARLAQIYRSHEAALDALACLEWVAQVPPATEENGHELAYELAVTLEALGEEAQALGVYRELIAEVGSGYRDVASRLERLAAA